MITPTTTTSNHNPQPQSPTTIPKHHLQDSSRSLATMQFDEIKSRKIDDLTPEQLKTMDDWDIKFETKRFYPIVGDLTN